MAKPKQTDVAEITEAKTLRGDIRDQILAEFKGMPKPWQQMNEAEQRRVIERASEIALMLVTRAVRIAAHEGAPHLTAEVGQFTVKDGLKVQMAAAGTVENITRLAEHRGAAVIVLVDPAKYHGERQKAQPDVVGDLRLPRPASNGEAREDEANISRFAEHNASAGDPIDELAR